MLLIVFLIVSTGAISAYARSRGGKPYLWGTLSVAGCLLIQFGGGFILAALHIPLDADAPWIILGMSCGWVGLMALCTRFLIGMNRPRPSGMWSCPNCSFLNQHYAVVCEACSQPYAQKN
jgi:hypothetical protein